MCKCLIVFNILMTIDAIEYTDSVGLMVLDAPLNDSWPTIWPIFRIVRNIAFRKVCSS